MIGNEALSMMAYPASSSKRYCAEPREGLLRAGNLAGRRGIGIVERIGIKNRRDARALLVAGRRVERERQVKSVGALVLHQALLDRRAPPAWDRECA